MRQRNDRGFLRGRGFFLFLGYFFSIVPALAATVSFFPIYAAEGAGEKSLSLFSVLLVVIACIPLLRLLRRAFRSPAAWQVYLLLFLLFYITGRIAREMMCISLVGCVGAGIGALFLWLAGRGGEERDDT